MAGKRSPSRRKHRWLKWTAATLLLVLLALGVIIGISLHRIEPTLRAVIVEKLSEHFHARVELDSFHISVAKGLWAEGKGLRIWPPAELGRTTFGSASATPGAASPLVTLDDFRFHTPLHYKPGTPIRISVVNLEGLNIDIPPRPPAGGASSTPAASTSASSSTGSSSPASALFQFVIGSIVCTNAHLTIETNKPDKLPLVFSIAKVTVTHVGAQNSMPFVAELTNPRPAGTIKTSGSFGPIATDDMGETPVSGNYSLIHSDMGVFKGIAGILDSTGKYDGVLRQINVEGDTTVPDFRLTDFGTPLPLHTHFQALVDGTSGDTRLHQVDATLGQSHFTTSGEIVRQKAQVVRGRQIRPSGHEISLNVNVDRGHIDDFLRLTSKDGDAVMTGLVQAKSTLEIPPGTERSQKRIKLNGSFVLDDVQFTSDKVQNWIQQLSLRGQGDPKAAKNGGDQNVLSSMQSKFTMAGGVIALPDLTYIVPGAEIDMKGQYVLQGGVIDFAGFARTEATISQMVGGWKGFLLKPADRFFKKNGAGTQLPIHVSGTREHPKFGVDLGRVKHTSPATPGQQ